MDIKYNITKYKDNNVEEIKDLISVEEPLEMNLQFQKNGKWINENISIRKGKYGPYICLLYTSPSPRDS